MKIHKVIFQNLNSLVGRHEIDLSAGPLADAGIFAITGPTGAGKSTILDAITLALYGRAARYDAESTPENMMSRHTGECSAEVVFEVPAGRFRATWHLNRARKKHDGKIQTAKRCLYDGNEVPIAEKKNDVNAKVDELVGLDMNRFLRSALLAQNQFAEFLKSKPDERSALLEKLTGTDIYSRLGKLAHEMHAAKKNELDIQLANASAIQVLSAQERNEIESSATNVESQIEGRRNKLIEIDADIVQGEKLEAALLAQKKAEDERAILNDERNAFASVARRLELSRAASVLAGPLAQVDSLVGALEAHHRKAEQAGRDYLKAKLGLSLCGDQVKQFAAEFERKLDGEIGSLAIQRAAVETGVKRTAAKLEDNAVDKELAKAMGSIGASLARLGEARRLQSAERDRKLEFESKSKELRREVEDILALINNAQEERDRKTSRVADLEKQTSAASKERSSEDLRSAVAFCRDADLRLSRMLASVERRDGLLSKRKLVKNESKQIRKGLDRVESSAKEIEARVEQQEELVAALREAYQRGQLVVGLHEHRHALESGAPCPLCGSVKHPYAMDVLTESGLALDAKKLAAAEDKCVKLQRKKVEVLEELQRVKSEYEVKKAECKLLSDQYDELQPSIQELASELNLKSTDQGLVSGELSRVKSELKTLEEQVVAINILATELGDAKTAAELANGILERQRACLTRVNTQLAEIQSELGNAVSKLVRCETNLAKQVDELTKLLAPFLPVADRVPEPGAEDELRQSLQQRVDDHAALTEELASLEQQWQQLQTAGDTLAGQRRDLSDRRAKTLALVPKSEDTSPSLFLNASDRVSAQEVVAQAAKGWGAIDDALETMNDLVRQSANAEAITNAADNVAKETRSKLNQSRLDLESSIAGSIFESVAALRSAVLSEKEFTDLADKGKELENRIQQNAGQIVQVAQLLSALQGKRAPTGEQLKAKRLEKRKIEDESQAEQQRLGGWRQQLKADDENRKQREDCGRTIAEQEQRLESWRKMRNLIGSADGSKFRRFAQGLTLDLLVRLANRHLGKLSERYRLKRVEEAQLDLEIADLHQGGTCRPMKSLSGGESFIASLALALGLSDLAGRNVRIDSLFIDEGFGSLDPETLDVAVATLESLQSSNKTIGVISHVELLKERITAQINVQPTGGGISKLEVVG